MSHADHMREWAENTCAWATYESHKKACKECVPMSGGSIRVGRLCHAARDMFPAHRRPQYDADAAALTAGADALDVLALAEGAEALSLNEGLDSEAWLWQSADGAWQINVGGHGVRPLVLAWAPTERDTRRAAAARLLATAIGLMRET